MKRIVALVVGIVAVLLGALWFFQGLGLFHLRPILCFADCAPIQGPSVSWAITGAVTLIVGGFGIRWSRKPTTLPEAKEIKWPS